MGERARVDVELVELAGLRVERSDEVPLLPDEPDAALLVGDRVARAGVLPWHLPLVHGNRLRDRRRGGDQHREDSDSDAHGSLRE